MTALATRRKVLITGANGFVGRHLIATLAALPDPPDIVAGVFNADAGDGLPRLARPVRLDVTDAAEVRDVVKAEEPTHLVHLAGLGVPSQAGREVRRTWDVNVGGTLNVILAIRHGAPECRLLFCSSALVYGGSFRPGRPLAEDALLCPENLYASSKAAADLLVGQMASDGLRAVRLRPFNHTGPGQSPHLVVPAFATQIAAIERDRQEPVLKVGDLSLRRDFVDVRDVVDAYVRTILRFDELANGAVFNIASGTALALEQILGMLLSMSSKSIAVVRDPQRLRRNEPAVIVGDSAAARGALGWVPRWPMADTLKSVLDHCRGVSAGLR